MLGTLKFLTTAFMLTFLPIFCPQQNNKLKFYTHVYMHFVRVFQLTAINRN